MPVTNPKLVVRTLVNNIRSYHERLGAPKGHVNISGGIDSALIAALLVEALGPQNVSCAYIRINSSESSRQRAQELADGLGLQLADLDFTQVFTDMTEHMIEALAIAEVRTSGCPASSMIVDRARSTIRARIAADPTILGSFRSCLRAPIGREINRMTGNGIVHGTGNECEDRWLRFFQKGGDGETDTAPISMLSKGEVFQVSRFLCIPRSILTARPSPDLWGDNEGHNDEDEIGAFMRINPAEWGKHWYSYVDMNTGKYQNVGLIERVSRLADWCGNSIFGESDPNAAEYLSGIRTLAFEGSKLSSDQLLTLLQEARRVERMTRHKANLNIYPLTTRAELYNIGALTYVLPTL